MEKLKEGWEGGKWEEMKEGLCGGESLMDLSSCESCLSSSLSSSLSASSLSSSLSCSSSEQDDLYGALGRLSEVCIKILF